MPKAQKGQRFGGRQKGTPNLRSVEAYEKLVKLNCDPLERMVEIARLAMADGELAIAGSMYKELAQYAHPKRKAVEIKASVGLYEEVSHLTRAELLERLKDKGVGSETIKQQFR